MSVQAPFPLGEFPFVSYKTSNLTLECSSRFQFVRDNSFLLLFPSIFCAISAFSLFGENVVRSFLPNDIFLPCDHGLDF